MERELWRILSQSVARLERRYHDERRTHQTGRIVRVFLWAALYDRPTCWACRPRNWVGVKPPRRLPDQSTMSRRLRYEDTRRMLKQLAHSLSESDYDSLVHYLDSKPLTVSRQSRDRDAKHGRGAGGTDRGYKLLIAARMKPAAKGVAHGRHSPHRLDALNRQQAPSPFVRELFAQRKQVETRFAHLTNFGGALTCLPPWVRTLPRVHNWVAAKSLIRLARDQRQRPTAA